MPADYNHVLWRALYQRHDGERLLTYGRDFFADATVWERRAKAIIEATSLSSDSTVLVVGCGIGLLIEQFIADGYPNVWGVDASQWVIDRLDVESKVPDRITLGTIGWDEPFADAGFPTHYDVVVDEDAMSAHWGDEVATFNAALGALGDKVVHVTTPLRGTYGDSALNWRTMEEWKQTAPEHVWMDSAAHKVV